ncbi:MAG: type II toxin-antitoxin system VapC family toxin [Acidobacteriaceae bacterium]|jgi:ribonuclease VapC
MVIDSSALLAIFLEEPDASIYASAILNDRIRLVSAATLAEASIVAIRRRQPDPIAALDILTTRLRLVVIPVDHEQALLARDGFRRFGKGRHPAGLNFGDCFSYALAKQRGEPLLFKGNDFSQTDVLVA